jgi:hypothetical protein
VAAVLAAPEPREGGSPAKSIPMQPARLPLQKKDRQLGGRFFVGAYNFGINFFVALRRDFPGKVARHRALH